MLWVGFALATATQTGCFMEFLVGGAVSDSSHAGPCPPGEVLCGDACSPAGECPECPGCGSTGTSGDPGTSTATTTEGSVGATSGPTTGGPECGDMTPCPVDPTCSGPGCDATTIAGSYCGDGVVDIGEQCDDGDDDDDDECTSACRDAACGDGFVGPGEGCDDGNHVDDDECTNQCSPQSCGDGVVQAGVEQCDDGDADDGDGCLSTCVLASCGDGVVQVGVEQCDDGNADDGDACTTLCAPPTCDDGLQSGDESDIDCGGSECTSCADGAACAGDGDCALGKCSLGACGYVTSCLDVVQRAPKSQSGVYAIDPDGAGSSPELQVYCDHEVDGGGWTMVYKLSAGIGGDPYPLWIGGALNENDVTLLHVAKSTKHYVSGFVGKFWNNNGVTIQDVRVHVYRDGALERFWRFNAPGSTKTNWFETARLLDSSYKDLPNSPYNIFSIAGDNWKGAGRRWFINRNYNDCGQDNGWLVVDTDWNPCLWEANKGSPSIRILYSPTDTYTNWWTATSNGSIGSGEVFAVFVR